MCLEGQEQKGRQGWVLWVFASSASNKGRSQMPKPELGAAKPNTSPEDGNAFVISANVNYAERESGLNFSLGMWIMSHRETLFLFLFAVFSAGFYFSQEMDGGLNNTVFLFFPQMSATSAPLIRELPPLTFLRAKTALHGSRCTSSERLPRCHPSIII